MKSKNQLLRIYRSQPKNIDSEAVKSSLRVQKEWHKEKMENALKHLDLSNKRVLDLGCGSGGITRKMKELNPSAKIFGVDFNPDAISYAKNTDSGTKGLN